MAFVTKLDYSSNRQVKQYTETFTILSGGTKFGLPFSALTTGPDPNNSGITTTQINVVSTFSGNTGTTVYTWYDSSMQIGVSRLSALTSSNSATTQSTGDAFSASTTTIIDGNTVALGYTGVNFNITVISMIGLGGNNYSGTVYTNIFETLSAGTLDFTGRTIWVDVSGITRTNTLEVTGDATFLNIGSQSSAGSLHYTSNGTLTTNTSDLRLKRNIEPIKNALNKVLNLNGVYYNWYDSLDGDKRIGFIAQDVQKVVPELVFKNEKSEQKLLGVHYDNITALLVEAIKELVNNNFISRNINEVIETQTIKAEDNNIELNFGGTHKSSINGGLVLLHGISDGKHSELVIDEKGDWVTNNNFKSKGLVIPRYNPNLSNDDIVGSVKFDEDFIYVKTENGWKQSILKKSLI